MEKNKHGGPRANSGRKPIDDPKQGLWLYVPGSVLTKLGKQKAKTIGEKALATAASKINLK